MTTVASIAWVREELEAHGSLESLKAPLEDTRSLCAFLKDGRALCLLTNALTQAEKEENSENASETASELPKKLQRSLNQLSTFHALERVQFFIKWCRGRAQLDEHQIFTTVQLLDEVNEVAVNECMVALRKKYRPTAANKMAQFFDPDPAHDENSRLSGFNVGPANSAAAPSSSAGGGSANSSNRLSAFLNKFPTAPPAKATVKNPPPQPVKAPLPAVSVPKPIANRSSSISSVTSASSERLRASTTSFSEEIDDDAFDRTSSASASADRTSSTSASATSPKQQSTSRLRIPSIFKNNRSSTSTNATASTSRSSLTNSNGPPTPSNDSSEGSAPRSVSKLSIPAAFSRKFSSSSNGSGTQDTPKSPDDHAAESKLSAFAAFSNQSKSAPASIDKASATKSAPTSKLAMFLTSVEPASASGPAVAAPSQREEESAPPAQEEAPEEEVHEEAAPVEEPVEDESESLHDESFHSHEGSDRRFSIQSDRRSSIQSDRDHSFFVVEEVSVNHQASNHQPPQQSQSSSKLHAFLSVVEPTVADGPVSLDEPASANDAVPGQDEAEIEETSEPEAAAALPKEDAEEAPVEAVTQQAAVSPELVEENERLATENARLKDEIVSLTEEKESVAEALRLVNESAGSKDDLIEALRSELASTQQQLADAQAAADAKAQEAEQTEASLREEVSAAQAQLEEARQAAEAGVNNADEEKRDLADQVRELTAAAESHASELASLREQLETLEQSAQLAKDQEEAARFAAQTAFAARDAAEERAAQLEAQLKQ